MEAVSLATYTHDPGGGLLKAVKERMSLLTDIYDEQFVVVTDATDDVIIAQLEDFGCTVAIQEDGVVYERVGDARRMAVSVAADGSRGYMHFVDFDRILQWAGSHPGELRRVVGEIPRHDFLIIGRTQRAMESHPVSQRETERLANKVASLVLGREVDVTATSRGLSPEAARTVLEYSNVKSFETDSEWPVIIQCQSEMRIGYIEVDGLGFEDWLQYADDVDAAGGLENWKRAKDEDPARWLHRMRLAQMIAEAALATYNELA
ncbi:unnamed protein product [marine sediment metagenome]|uniref:Glycosyltransferase 2-like domain-containing protein n=1 Tax=marine sediment metagenome TaxID=412755 RepID=X0TLQ5_9ZZZZ